MCTNEISVCKMLVESLISNSCMCEKCSFYELFVKHFPLTLFEVVVQAICIICNINFMQEIRECSYMEKQ